MITIDTSGLFAILNRDDPHHQRVRNEVVADRGPWLIPAATLGEVAYLIEHRLSPTVLNAFIEDLQESRFVLDCGDSDLARVRALVQRYDDLPLGLVDAAVIACAERNGGRVLTLDVRHFGVVSRDSPIVLLPDPYV
ncbi:MAG TPA: PIN domain-containing protein [Thermomicrobiales bacterium]|nr:PIN domain-containing protein [Thermomicrobiales bacterium]